MKAIADRIRYRAFLNKSSARESVTLDSALPEFADFSDQNFAGVRVDSA